eukprot:4748483-Lingulodinium_polyedra.AAC.1
MQAIDRALSCLAEVARLRMREKTTVPKMPEPQEFIPPPARTDEGMHECSSSGVAEYSATLQWHQWVRGPVQ